MDRHAGFAAALVIRGETIQDLQRIAYHAGIVGHQLAGQAGSVAADLFLDLPRLEFHHEDDDQVRVLLQAWGPLTITPDNLPAETRQVLFKATVLASPVVGLTAPTDAGTTAKLTLALGNAFPPVLAMSIDPLAGGPYSIPAQTVIDSSAFHTAVQALIGQRLTAMSSSDLDAGFLGGIADAGGRITPVVRDGVLGIGIDVFATTADGVDIATTGDPNAITDFTDGDDFAVSINAIAAPLAFDGIRDGIAKQISDQGADLDSYSFGVEDGDFFVGGSASSSEGSVTFSMRAVPHLTRPGYSREYDELWFDMIDIDVDVDLSWWAAALATIATIITMGFGAVVVEGLMSSEATSITADISRSSLQRQAARVRDFTLAGTTAPLIRLTLERFDCLAEEVFISSTIRAQIPAPKFSGPYRIPVEEAVAARSVDFSLRLPFDAHSADPQLNIRWTVSRNDTHEEVFVADRAASTVLTLRISADFIPFLECSSFTIACRVYRTLGSQVVDLFSGTQTLEIYDPVDRTHPYVHWTHEVWTPEVLVRGDGSRELLGYAAKGRRSKLHRTDVPGRCRSVSHFSRNQIRDPGPGVTPSAIAYLDTLPFPRPELVEYRAKVCDYCFFGGPTKTIPLIP